MARNRKSSEAEALIRLIGEDEVTKLIKAAQDGVLGIADATKKASAQTEELTDNWKFNVISLDSALSLAQGVMSAVSGTFDVLKEAAAAAAVDHAFTRRFADSEATVNRLRDAVQGALSDRELKAFATQLNRANVSIEDTTRLLEVAGRISGDTGMQLAQVTEELADAVIGASDSNLEKFGIIVDLPELAKKYAAEQGIAADKIDKSVESAAILDAILTDVSAKFEGAQLSGLQAQTAQLEASWNNIVDATTEWALNLILPGQELGASLDRVDKLFRSTGASAAAWREELNQSGITLDEVADRANKMADASDRFLAIASESTSESVRLSAAFAKLAKQAEVGTAEYEALNNQIQILAVQRLGPLNIRMMGAEEGARALAQETQELAHQFGLAEKNALAQSRAIWATTEATFAAAKAEAELRYDKERSAAVEAMRAKAIREETAALAKYNKEQAAASARPKVTGGKRSEPVQSSRELFSQLYDFFVPPASPPKPQAAETGMMGPPDELIEQIQRARFEVDALANSFNAFGGSIENALIGSLARAGQVVTDEVGRITELFKAAEEAGIGTGKAVAMAAPGAIKAGADIAKGLGASIEVTETLYGLADVAQSATRFAMQDYLGGSMFAVSAGLHFAAAGAAASAKGGGGAKGGAGRSAPRAPSSAVGQAGGGGGGASYQITQVFSGVMIGPGGVREASREVRRITEDEATRGARSADFVPAG